MGISIDFILYKNLSQLGETSKLKMTGKRTYLGIDLGSISVKVALIDDRDQILFSRWVRVAGAPFGALEIVFDELKKAHPDANIAAIGITGSGKNLISNSFDAILVNEITAQAASCRSLYPDIKSIIEIGGQDSKFIILSEGKDGASFIKEFRMNELCAAGTGAFLDQQAARLKIPIEDFARLGVASKNPAEIAGRCAVFAKSDMTHHQQEGRSLEDIVAGLNHALVRSYLANLVRGNDIPRPVSFQGAVAANDGLVLAFRKVLNLGVGELVIPEHYRVMGAIGAAMIARSKCKNNTVPFRRETRDARHETAPTKVSSLESRVSRPIQTSFTGLNLDSTYLGIDVGSVSVKLVAIGPDGLVFSDYQFSDGHPIDVLKEMLNRLQTYERTNVLTYGGVGITGSGRHFLGKLIGADAIQNEITAQIRAANFIFPKVDTVVEIGGQDAKFLRIENGHASYFAMNRVCAAGTGAFLQEHAERLNIRLEEDFAKEAFLSQAPAILGARCTVFMESDLVASQQQGCEKRDLLAGLAFSVVENYLEKVVGNHSIGENILFLGGVAENLAVVSALESKLEKPVHTSGLGKISGALGAALAAHDAKKRGEYSVSKFNPDIINLDYEQFTCRDCSNLCRITRIKGANDKKFGGRCGKWDEKSGTPRAKQESYLEKRRNSLFSISDKQLATSDRRRATVVGIPRAILAFDRLPAWRAFFESLGADIVLSPTTNTKLLDEGMRHLVVETCLPIKAFCSHVHWLDKQENVDFIFVPSYVITGTDKHSRDTLHCPYIQGLSQFAAPLTSKPILRPVVNWRLDPNDEEKEMVDVARKLGATNEEAKNAWRRHEQARGKFRSEMRSLGNSVISKLKGGKLGRAFVLLGKDYNISDERLNSGAAKILESRGEIVLTQDMLACDDGSYSSAYSTMYWSHGKEMLAAATLAAETANLYPVLITSFGCGPDSFTTGFVKNIMGKKPMLILEVDEHSSSVGMETRIEAFLDSLPSNPVSQLADTGTIFRPHGPIRTVYLPNFSDHSLAFAASIKALGLNPVLTALPDDEAEAIGSKHASMGECHPFILMLGSYIKAARSGADFNSSCYFMPESASCRVGQFGAQMQLVANNLGLALPVCTKIHDIASSVSTNSVKTYVRAVLSYWETIRGLDFLLQKYLETRAYEVTAGAADSAYSAGKLELEDLIFRGDHKKGLAAALSHLNAVKVDHSQNRVKIGITGDYYTRICDYANSNVFRNIEKLGGMILLPPTMSEFIKYNAHQKPMAAINHKNPKELLQALILRSFVDKKEKEVRAIFGDSLIYDIPVDYKRGTTIVKKYISHKLPAGITASVVAILDQIHAGADGILSLITFHCNYGLVIGSVLSMIDRDYPDIPKLTLIYEGLKPTHNTTRLEAFMERVHESRKN